MKLRRVLLQNVRSFLEPAELHLDGPITIIIGPNGGGKTNLLDAATTSLRRHILTSWVPFKSPTPEVPDRFEFRQNDALNDKSLEKHSHGAGLDQVIELELEVTPEDVENIITIKNTVRRVYEQTTRFVGFSMLTAEEWDTSTVEAGQRWTFRIVNNALEVDPSPGAKVYREYLSFFEADNRLRSSVGERPLSMPMMSMPVNRAGSVFQASLSLATHNESELKRSVDAASSRSAGSIVPLAVGRIAATYRLLLEQDTGNAKRQFFAEPQIAALTSILAGLGYKWDLEGTDPMTNQYDIRLEKEGSSFLVGAASSGEKELLTYLFAIYCLNLRNALIVVDEPELHLHPKWQNILLNLFETLTRETGNQFLLATHSPVFVSPASIQYVSRVFTQHQKSNVVRLRVDELPKARHLFAIVNSQNNERMFFADVVVLVEGISDRVFFDAVFRKIGVYDDSLRTYEIVEVGGKGYFSAYEQLLTAFSVPHTLIADADYLNEIGTSDLKAMFTVNEKKIAGDVILNPTSQDGASLVRQLEGAIATGSLEELTVLWEYIKSRRLRLPETLGPDEQEAIKMFIESKRQEGVYILTQGALESYLPDGYRSKDLGKLIEFVSTDFWPALDPASREELAVIAESIKGLIH